MSKWAKNAKKIEILAIFLKFAKIDRFFLFR